MFALQNRGEMGNAVESEFENLISRIRGLWLTEHTEEGGHAAITATSVISSGPVAGTSGTFSDNVIADSDNCVTEIGNAGTTNPIFGGGGIRMKHSALSDWLMHAEQGFFGAAPSLMFRDLTNLNVSTGVMALYRSTAVNATPGDYWLVPLQNTVNLNLGEDVSGRRWNVNAKAVVATSGYSELFRAFNMGEFQTTAYNAANFSASAGSWTLPSSAAQVTFAYSLVGHQMTVMFEIEGTSVTAAPGTLAITIPASKVAAKRTHNLFQAIDKGTANIGVAKVDIAGTQIVLQASIAGAGWTTTAANDTSVRGQITFEIQ